MSVVLRAVVPSGSSDLFLGCAYRANQSSRSTGPCKIDKHSTVLSRKGSRDGPKYLVQQGKRLFAVRDSRLYCHHLSEDQLWTAWTTFPDQATRGGGWEIRDPDFRNTQFAFYDQKQRLVHVKINDSVNTHNLSYTYDSMDSDADGIKFTTGSSGKPPKSEIETSARTPKVLSKDESKSFALTRREPTEDEIRAHSDEGLTPDDLEEALVVKRVKVPRRSFMAFRVFINLPNADLNTPLDINEFVGMITNIPHRNGSGINFRLSIGATLKGLHIPSCQSVAVTFVPQEVKEDVPFDGLETEWL